MGAIFKPEPLTWEDINGGCGEALLETIRTFIEDVCYTDEPADYPYDEQLTNDLIFFAEEWERLDGWESYGKKSDAFKTAAVLSLIGGAFFDSMAGDRIAEKLTKAATKPNLVEIMTRVASAYCLYIALKARIEIEEVKRRADKERG